MNKENDMIVAQDTFIVYGGAGCSNCKQVVQLLMWFQIIQLIQQ